MCNIANALGVSDKARSPHCIRALTGSSRNEPNRIDRSAGIALPLLAVSPLIFTEVLPNFHHFFTASHSRLAIFSTRMTRMKNDSVLARPERRRKSFTHDPAFRLPLWGTFMVQFHVEVEVTQGQKSGRIEQVHSGYAIRFRSLRELRGFVTQLLADTPPKRTRTKQPTRPLHHVSSSIRKQQGGEDKELLIKATDDIVVSEGRRSSSAFLNHS